MKRAIYLVPIAVVLVGVFRLASQRALIADLEVANELLRQRLEKGEGKWRVN